MFYTLVEYQVFVTGDTLRPWLVAVAVPDMEMMAMCAKEDFGKDVGAEGGELSKEEQEGLCRDPAVRSHVLRELQKAGKAFGLPPHELLRNVHLRPERFSVENGLLSAEHKPRRFELRQRFQKDIEKLFQEIESGTAPLDNDVPGPAPPKTNKPKKLA